MKTLKEIRKDKGIKATYVADKLGITPQGLYAIEADKVRLTAYTFLELCKIYGVSPFSVDVHKVKYQKAVTD